MAQSRVSNPIGGSVLLQLLQRNAMLAVWGEPARWWHHAVLVAESPLLALLLAFAFAPAELPLPHSPVGLLELRLIEGYFGDAIGTSAYAAAERGREHLV